MESQAQQVSKTTSPRFTRIVFTVNNYTIEEVEWFYSEKFTDLCKWCVIAKEVGASGTPHLQGACVFKKQMYVKTLKKLLGFVRSHIEMMRGSPNDSLRYCMKDDGKPFIFGEIPVSEQGKRNDLHNVVERVLKGENIRQLSGDVSGATAIVKFHKGLTVLRNLRSAKRNGVPIICWLYGATGCGKSFNAWKLAREVGGDDDIWINTFGLRWFDGYEAQRVAIIDDYRNKDCKFSYLLRLLDRYPLRVEFKGGMVEWQPKYIFITTTQSIDEMFAERDKYVKEDVNQLRRRITAEFFFPDQRADFKMLVRRAIANDGENGGLRSGRLPGQVGRNDVERVERLVRPMVVEGSRGRDVERVEQRDRVLEATSRQREFVEWGVDDRRHARASDEAGAGHHSGAMSDTNSDSGTGSGRGGKCLAICAEVVQRQRASQEIGTRSIDQARSREEAKDEEDDRSIDHGRGSSESEESYETQVGKRRRRDLGTMDIEEERGNSGGMQVPVPGGDRWPLLDDVHDPSRL